ncbi:unnamed protein product [Amoebophrya sp. A25]|nr:unnamed protein product [Amoebophrya sp. A25]|eukprot:GSA25T00004267001.1
MFVHPGREGKNGWSADGDRGGNKGYQEYGGRSYNHGQEHRAGEKGNSKSKSSDRNRDNAKGKGKEDTGNNISRYSKGGSSSSSFHPSQRGQYGNTSHHTGVGEKAAGGNDKGTRAASSSKGSKNGSTCSRSNGRGAYYNNNSARGDHYADHGPSPNIKGSGPREGPDPPPLQTEHPPFTFLELANSEEHRKNWRVALWDEEKRSYAFYYPNYLAEDKLLYYYNEIKKHARWEPVWGGSKISRQTAWYVHDTDCTCIYTYGHDSRIPNKSSDAFKKLMHELWADLGFDKMTVVPNSVNLNLYENETQGCGWHADNENLFDGVRRDCRILSMSLGGPREFWIGEKHDRKAKRDTIVETTLHAGDLITMEGMMQKHHLHYVPYLRSRENIRPRINLTFRDLVVHKPNCKKRRMQVGGSTSSTAPHALPAAFSDRGMEMDAEEKQRQEKEESEVGKKQQEEESASAVEGNTSSKNTRFRGHEKYIHTWTRAHVPWGIERVEPVEKWTNCNSCGDGPDRGRRCIEVPRLPKVEVEGRFSSSSPDKASTAATKKGATSRTTARRKGRAGSTTVTEDTDEGSRSPTAMRGTSVKVQLQSSAQKIEAATVVSKSEYRCRICLANEDPRWLSMLSLDDFLAGRKPGVASSASVVLNTASPPPPTTSSTANAQRATKAKEETKKAKEDSTSKKSRKSKQYAEDSLRGIELPSVYANMDFIEDAATLNPQEGKTGHLPAGNKDAAGKKDASLSRGETAGTDASSSREAARGKSDARSEAVAGKGDASGGTGKKGTARSETGKKGARAQPEETTKGGRVGDRKQADDRSKIEDTGVNASSAAPASSSPQASEPEKATRGKVEQLHNSKASPFPEVDGSSKGMSKEKTTTTSTQQQEIKKHATASSSSNINKQKTTSTSAEHTEEVVEDEKAYWKPKGSNREPRRRRPRYGRGSWESWKEKNATPAQDKPRSSKEHNAPTTGASQQPDASEKGQTREQKNGSEKGRDPVADQQHASTEQQHASKDEEMRAVDEKRLPSTTSAYTARSENHDRYRAEYGRHRTPGAQRGRYNNYGYNRPRKAGDKWWDWEDAGTHKQQETVWRPKNASR